MMDVVSDVVWQAKAMVQMPEQDINSRFIKTGIQRQDKNSKTKHNLETRQKCLFLRHFRKQNMGQWTTTYPTLLTSDHLLKIF